MDEDDKELLIQTSERSKSNTHQIDKIEDRIKDIETEQKALYELTSSVKSMAENISDMKSDIKEVKKGQFDLSNKMDNQITDVKQQVQNMKDEPYNNYKKTKQSIKIQIITGIGKAIGIGLIGYICALIGAGIIQL
jgi:uncharacterized protein YdcH (DUF465 family)